MKYRCPLCQQPLILQPTNTQLICRNNHQFDRAKQGYFNLLPVQHKKSKVPGDSKEMIVARENFLAGNYYLPLAKKLANIVNELLNERVEPTAILDIGCGEGYYSRVIADHNNSDQYGFDISKPAVQKAARKHKDGHYSVASSEHIPLLGASIDLAFKVYAPVSDRELQRVVKANGFMVNVTPAPRHLWQLREFIYDNVRPHDTVDTTFEGFNKISSEQFNYDIMPSKENRLNLLQMTPFAWKADEAMTQAIGNAESTAIELDFIISIYQKNV